MKACFDDDSLDPHCRNFRTLRSWDHLLRFLPGSWWDDGVTLCPSCFLPGPRQYSSIRQSKAKSQKDGNPNFHPFGDSVNKLTSRSPKIFQAEPRRELVQSSQAWLKMQLTSKAEASTQCRALGLRWFKLLAGECITSVPGTCVSWRIFISVIIEVVPNDVFHTQDFLTAPPSSHAHAHVLLDASCSHQLDDE